MGYEKRLGKTSQSSLTESRLRGDLIVVFTYLKDRQEDGDTVLSAIR